MSAPVDLRRLTAKPEPGTVVWADCSLVGGPVPDWIGPFTVLDEPSDRPGRVWLRRAVKSGAYSTEFRWANCFEEVPS
jgi:hypothetical protein